MPCLSGPNYHKNPVVYSPSQNCARSLNLIHKVLLRHSPSPMQHSCSTFRAFTHIYYSRSLHPDTQFLFLEIWPTYWLKLATQTVEIKGGLESNAELVVAHDVHALSNTRQHDLPHLLMPALVPVNFVDYHLRRKFSTFNNRWRSKRQIRNFQLTWRLMVTQKQYFLFGGGCNCPMVNVVHPLVSATLIHSTSWPSRAPIGISRTCLCLPVSYHNTMMRNKHHQTLTRRRLCIKIHHGSANTLSPPGAIPHLQTRAVKIRVNRIPAMTMIICSSAMCCISYIFFPSPILAISGQETKR